MLIESQQQAISVKAELSERKTEQAGNAEETRFKPLLFAQWKQDTYSLVVSQNPQPSAPVISKENLKKVVENVVNEEDRSRNVVIVRLIEEEGEELNGRVEELFFTIGPKPRLEACETGRNKNA